MVGVHLKHPRPPKPVGSMQPASTVDVSLEVLPSLGGLASVPPPPPSDPPTLNDSKSSKALHAPTDAAAKSIVPKRNFARTTPRTELRIGAERTSACGAQSMSMRARASAMWTRP